MKGIIYTRVSSEEQVNGTSLEFQEELCRTYCTQKNIEVVSVFREEGETAKDLSLNNRKQFLAALEFCRKRKKDIDAFIVLRVDRFARNTEDHFAVRRILSDYGTSLHSVTEPIGNKPAEKFIETVLAGAAEYDNAIRKQRCTEGMISRINQGIFPWKPPIGYKCAHSKKRGEKKITPDQLDEDIFPIIQQALKEYATGNYSLTAITQKLKDSGLKTTRNKKVTVQFVEKLFGRYLPFYAGIIVNPWTKQIVEGKHIAMITPEEMHRIRCIKAGKSLNHGVKHEKFNENFPLRKTIRCGSCDKFLTASISKGRLRRYPYYHCHNRSCTLFGKSISKDNVTNDFIILLKKITPKQSFLRIFSEIILDLWKERKMLFDNSYQQFEKRITNLESKKERLFDIYEEGEYTKDEFSQRKQMIELEIVTTKTLLSEMKFEDFDIEDVLNYILNFITNFEKY